MKESKKKSNSQSIEQDVETLKNDVQTDFDTPLNPRFSVGIDVDLMNHTSADAYYEGESIDAHRQIEQANEYIAEEEFKQERENL
jgi:hypothetical protein